MCFAQCIFRHITIFCHKCTARITEGTGTIVVSRKCHHLFHTRFIVGCKQGHIWYGSEIGDIEYPLMGLTVLTYNPGTVDGESHPKIHQTDIVYDLIVSSLQEGRIDGTEGLESLFGKRSHGSNSMLLSNRYIPEAFRIFFHRSIQPCTTWHRSGYSHNRFIFIRHSNQCLGEDLRCCFSSTFFVRFTCFGIKRTHPMPVFFGAFGNLIPFAFGCLRVNDDRLAKPFGHLHCLYQRSNIMSVYRTDILDTHLFKKHPRGDQLK